MQKCPSFAHPDPFPDISTPILSFLKLSSPSLPNLLFYPDQCEWAELVVVLWTLPRIPSASMDAFP